MSRSTSRSQKPSDPLVGKHFLTLNEEGAPKYQGMFIGTLPEGHYLVQFFEWFVGGRSEMGVLSVSQLQTDLSDQKGPNAILIFEDGEERDHFLQHVEPGRRAAREACNR